jgi:hypothetical protein
VRPAYRGGAVVGAGIVLRLCFASSGASIAQAGAGAAHDGHSDWSIVGLVLCIAGGFLLANAILFRHPRDLVEEHFAAARGRLLSIRETAFNRVQVALGFLLLLGGFGLQLFERLANSPEPTGFLATWVGLTVVGVALLQALGWWLSQRLIRRYVRAYLLQHEPELETDSKLARELGDLFGVEPQPDDTVQSFVARLRAAVGLPRVPRAPRPRPERLAEPVGLGDE